MSSPVRWHIVRDNGCFLEAKIGYHWTLDVDKAYMFDNLAEAWVIVKYLNGVYNIPCKERLARW